MKTFAGALVFLFSISGLAVHANPLPIDQYRNKILSDELDALIAPRLAVCPLPQLEQMYRESKTASLQAFEKTLALLPLDQELIQQETGSSGCQAELKKVRLAQHREARKKFKNVFVLFPRSKLLQELDPNCAPRVGPDYNGSLDGNPCFAGAHIILKDTLKSFGPEFETQLTRYEQGMAALKTAVLASTSKSTLDLVSAMRLDPASVIALFSLSLTSATSSNGYVDAYGIPVIRGTWKAGGDALLAYRRYMRIKNLADEGRYFLEGARKRELKIELLDTDVLGWNRHNWMAASLSLHYQALGKPLLANQLPVLLGTLYESRDAVSHVKEGLMLKRIWKEFKTDRNRYVQGVRLAKKLR